MKRPNYGSLNYVFFAFLGRVCLSSPAYRCVSWICLFFVFFGEMEARGQDELPLENAILKALEPIRVSAQVAGIIAQLDLHEGSQVIADQEVGHLRDTAVRLQLVRATTALEIAKAKQANDIDERLASKSSLVADNEYQRAVNANRSVPDTYPANEIGRLKLVAEKSLLEIERAAYQRSILGLETRQAEGEVEQAKELLARHRIVAPCSGVVVNVFHQPGEWVEPGKELFAIVRTDRMRVEGFLAASKARHDLIGKRVLIRDFEGEEEISLEGRVSFVSPEANPVNSLVRVFVDIEHTESQPRSGLRVRAVVTGNP